MNYNSKWNSSKSVLIYLYTKTKKKASILFLSHNDKIWCTIDSKIPFTPKGDRFCEENFLRYQDLCYVNQSEASRNCFHTFEYYAVVGWYTRILSSYYLIDNIKLKINFIIIFNLISTYNCKFVTFWLL